jgi:IS5 family transposase
MQFVQQGFTLADQALEDALCDSQASREFVGIALTLRRWNAPSA